MTKAPPSDVYSTSSGLKQISNPVRQRVLSELQRRDMSLSEIAQMTGKAQSTLSVHLDKMVKEGLVASRDDPSDSRKKIFYLVSMPIGTATIPRDELGAAVEAIAGRSIGAPAAFLKGEVRAMALGVEAVGLDLGPVFLDVGRKMGAAVGRTMKSREVEDLIGEIREFFTLHDLGELSVYSLTPLTLIIKDEYDSSGLPEQGRKACLLNVGIIEGILEARTGAPMRAVRTECFGTRGNFCKFVLEPTLFG